MKRILLCWLLAAALLLAACSAQDAPTEAPETTEYAAPYRPVTAIDHCVVEPDEREAMSGSDREAFRALMDTLLSRGAEVELSVDAGRVDFLLELLHESPYYFFAKSVEAQGTRVSFTYAYGAEEQRRMLELMDSELLAIVNRDASPGDNELDVILKLYSAVTHRIEYDMQREDNKELGSPLFDYPADEMYKALRDGRGLCYGFAYVLRYAMLQRGIDAFCVYGECRFNGLGHEWVVFRWQGEYYHCDPAWDRSSGGYAKLVHFGKTDGERAADTVYPRSFTEYHEEGYPAVVCEDTRFSVFRDIVRFTYTEGHHFYFENRDGGYAIFDTESFQLTKAE